MKMVDRESLTGVGTAAVDSASTSGLVPAVELAITPNNVFNFLCASLSDTSWSGHGKPGGTCADGSGVKVVSAAEGGQNVCTLSEEVGVPTPTVAALLRSTALIRQDVDSREDAIKRRQEEHLLLSDEVRNLRQQVAELEGTVSLINTADGVEPAVVNGINMSPRLTLVDDAWVSWGVNVCTPSSGLPAKDADRGRRAAILQLLAQIHAQEEQFITVGKEARTASLRKDAVDLHEKLAQLSHRVEFHGHNSPASASESDPAQMSDEPLVAFEEWHRQLLDLEGRGHQRSTTEALASGTTVQEEASFSSSIVPDRRAFNVERLGSGVGSPVAFTTTRKGLVARAFLTLTTDPVAGPRVSLGTDLHLPVDADLPLAYLLLGRPVAALIERVLWGPMDARQALLNNHRLALPQEPVAEHTPNLPQG